MNNQSGHQIPANPGPVILGEFLGEVEDVIHGIEHATKFVVAVYQHHPGVPDSDSSKCDP